MASATTTPSPSSASSVEDVSTRTQQSPLASQRAKEQGRERRDWFPLSYREGFNQWWASLTPAVTEHRVLSFIPYLQQPPTQTATGNTPVPPSPYSSSAGLPLPDDDAAAASQTTTTTSSPLDPYGPRQWQSTLIQLPDKHRALNEFSVSRPDSSTATHNLVMLHGYGAGLAFFYKNYEALSRRPGWKLWSLDLLGMGRSARPAFRIQAKDRVGKISEAESWFVDALEAWRVERGIPMGGMTLVGHSLGGYLAVAYALKYPGRLDKLILASPVGIPEDPYAVSAELPEGRVEEREAQKRPYPRWLTTLWDANVSPFSLVRWAGPLGPRLVSGWTTRRFSHLPENEASALHDYSYSLFRQKGSGEYALAYILAPGAFARSPLIRRIHGVGRQYLEPHDRPIPDDEPDEEVVGSSSSLAARHQPRENGIPVVLMYGEHDWMDVAGGFAAEEKIKREKRLALEGKSKAEKESDNGDAKVVIIPRAGHHLYLDNAEDFNRVLLEEMEDVERRKKRQRRLEGLKSVS